MMLRFTTGVYSGPRGNRTRIPGTPGRYRPFGPEALVFQWRRWESNPSQAACEAASPPWYMRPRIVKPEVRPGLEPGLPPYQRGVPPQHLQTRRRGASGGGEATVG